MNEENLFYQRLIYLVNQSSKSMNKIERELGYPRNALNNYRHGGEPSGTRLIDLAQYFCVSPEYLMGRDEQPIEYIDPNFLFSKLKEDEKREILFLSQNWYISKLQKFGK